MLEYKEIIFFQKLPNSSHSSFYLKSDAFKKPNNSPRILGYFG